MSLFSRWFGTKKFEDERAEGDRAFDAQEFVEARLAYDRALDRADKDGAAEEDRRHCRERIAVCRDRMTGMAIEEAARLLDDGREDLARAELLSAVEVAASEEMRERVVAALDDLERTDARRAVEVSEELDDDAIWAILAGTWEEEQLEEYDTYGERFREALIALYDRKVDRGLELLEAVLEEALPEDEEDERADPVYLWLEVGRARLAAEDAEGAAEALEAFLDELEKGQGGDSRLEGHVLLARIHDDAGDEAKAIGWMQKAIKALPEDPRPYLALGSYLRNHDMVDSAVEILESALSLYEDRTPDWRVIEALGLARQAAGQDEAARKDLDQVITVFVKQARYDYPHEAAAGLAELEEAAGNPQRAADLWRSLAEGSHTDGHLRYHTEAGRLLAELGQTDEARRMWTRALALAEGDEEAQTDLAARLDGLG
jgi:tetratricopeptide (TPR) repeat protein